MVLMTHTEQQDDPLSASKHFAPVLEWSPDTTTFLLEMVDDRLHVL
jgi:hypothetical protein